ncbi:MULTISPECIES: LacI family DNA-binding transcriptional regulator [unclassified Chelatococcus]|uniref:LacI family DNA-binding transcriptional regulator n=1 Tax=unclassified Chelatococcus TaxID=2638111 RepID=UPI001BD188FF|nr:MULTISPECIES: LacI family DNA-binding transcriptional regulator [unclassified Chelatococcus]CAH1652708.1 HTH-type transcriptional repressor CytR [Hyphomicrobiales bacterium]MBS7740022.1 LacI family DNA-binding transcriptional regulator [Chelatococcus sp. HY11]MBX3545149.1 LacI family DNA-binding transcriptional regulator [Chelatococcus sp.]MCO5078678.1 LacI family DNA-binding transcriptional regulator [Chelatococcus sp.]CAH1685910.1 HTH-type transcriptional repressor CytR [Hyphomicrobiales 
MATPTRRTPTTRAPTNGAPTVATVAKLAGVSTATVSRALQRPDKVQPETRQRIMEAVAATGFVPNSQARNLRSRASRTVILLVRDISNPFYLEIYKGVEEAAVEAGYSVLMGDARDDDQRIQHYIDTVRARHADGLILMIGRFPEVLKAEIPRLPPIVIALETFPDVALPTVKIDNVAASREAVNHLIGLGHRRIAHITGPMPERLALDRLAGYRAALSEHGIAEDDALVINGDFSLAAGRRAVRQLFEAGTAFTALFAASDQMAVGAISELRARGLHVPADISVVGFDDIVLADAFEPPLTTVHQPRFEIGRQAMAQMIAMLSDAPPVATPDILMETRLIIRGSTGPNPHATRRSRLRGHVSSA